jgi:hypothetical protein
MDENTLRTDANDNPQDNNVVEELSIFELDERLEFVAWCDNCSCTTSPK